MIFIFGVLALLVAGFVTLTIFGHPWMACLLLLALASVRYRAHSPKVAGAKEPAQIDGEAK